MRKSLLAVLALTINFVTAQIFITEIADPNNASSARFVELFNMGTSDVDLGSGWALQRWTNAVAEPQTAVALTGTIPAGGFYLVSNNGSAFETMYGVAADQDVGTGGVGDSNGDDNIALLDASSTIVDMFGVAGEDGSGTGHEFEDGRAERVSTVTSGNATWTASEWDIDNDSGGGDGAQDAPGGFDPNVWFNYTDPVTSPAITKAYSISSTEIYVDYDQDLTSVAVADYTLTGTAGVTFSSATIDASDASVVYLTSSADIAGDATLDILADATNSADFDFYAGITPISATNEANSTGTIDNAHTATLHGTVSANDAYNNVWISDASGAYNGVLVFDYNFDSDVSVGDEITITATRDEYNGLTELKNPELISTTSTGNTPNGPDVISGSDIDATLTADTNPGEQWEGQLVKIDGATVVSYADADYEYTCTDDGGTTNFVVGSEVDYQLSSVSLSVGSSYSITGVVDYNGTYRINPRDAADAVQATNPGDSCEDPISYGATNDTEVTGDLAAGGAVWYTFTSAGFTTTTVSLCGGGTLSDSKLDVYAVCDGASIGYNDDGCDSGYLSEIVFTDLAAGEYKVKVYGYGSTSAGTFTLTITGSSADPCADFADTQEPNDSMTDATDATAGGTYTAALCPTTDLDYYMVTAEAGGTISCETNEISGTSYSTDTYLRLYDAAGTELVTNDDGGDGYTSLISYDVTTAGNYYFEVSVSSWAAGNVFDYSADVTNEAVQQRN
jgi:hypothetical protein